MANDADVTVAVKVVDNASENVKKIDKSFGGMAMTLGGLVSAAAIIGAGVKLAQFGKAALLAASDVEEMQSKFNAVFKGQATGVTAALTEFADAANRSVYDLQGFAATLQDTFVPLGFARDEAANMSVEIVKLAEDLASFNNLDSATVVQDFQSALVGNTETLRKYGIVAQQAQIQTKALEMGIWDGVGALTAQEKAQAILAITIESTTDAQGDAIRTADSFENQMKGLQSAIKDVQVGIGMHLLPTSSDMVGVFTDITRRVGPDLIAVFADLDLFMQAMTGSGDGVVETLGSMFQAMSVMPRMYLTAGTSIANSFREMGSAALFSADTYGDANQALETMLFTMANPAHIQAIEDGATGFIDTGEAALGMAAAFGLIPEAYTGFADLLGLLVTEDLPPAIESVGELRDTVGELNLTVGDMPAKFDGIVQPIGNARTALDNYLLITRNAAGATKLLGDKLLEMENTAPKYGKWIKELITGNEELYGSTEKSKREAEALKGALDLLNGLWVANVIVRTTYEGSPFDEPAGGGGTSTHNPDNDIPDPPPPEEPPDGSGDGGRRQNPNGRSGGNTFNFFGGNTASAGAIASAVAPRG